MSYIIAFSALFFTLVSSFFRNSGLFALLLIPIILILFGANYSNPDYENYLAAYELQKQEIVFETSQIGFIILMKLSSWLGLTYTGFLISVSIIGIFLIYKIVIKYTTKPNFVFALYFIHPFFLDIVQVKHFLAMSIVVFSTQFLIENKLTYKYKYISGILIASSIHYISLFFIPLAFIKEISIKVLFLIMAALSLTVLVLDNLGLIQTIAIKIAGESRTEHYFENRANLGFFVQYFIQTAMLVTVFFSVRSLRINNKSNKFIEIILIINIYLLILFPFYMINGTFERAFRMILILNYILFSLTLTSLSIKPKIFYSSFLIVIVGLLFYWHVYHNYSEEVFFSIFENNHVFKYLFNGG